MACETADLQLHLTFTSALDGGEWAASLSIRCTLGKSNRNALNRRMIVPGARLAALEHGSFIAPARNQTTNPQTPTCLVTPQIQIFGILRVSRKMKTWESNCYLKYKKQATVKVTGGRLEASSLNASRYRKSRMGPAEVIEAFNHWIQSPDIKYRERRHGDVSDWNLKTA